ncbi:hypothetical protein Glove_88g4 [Diversispora epigaea]|uniref:Uncharacterized protein n=1 Tax=Diversispora epigaea TaxID=1348612 RepID=A0A397JES8_9GLOM|nr:hypothetical protein Glove_88g4 [Diversispora epigaea]
MAIHRLLGDGELGVGLNENESLDPSIDDVTGAVIDDVTGAVINSAEIVNRVRIEGIDKSSTTLRVASFLVNGCIHTKLV